MDKIKFRGERTDNNELVYGNLIVNNNGKCWIVGEMIESNKEYCIVEFWYPVEPNTVGQFTGRKNSEGADVYSYVFP